jgi:hypothetical protein
MYSVRLVRCELLSTPDSHGDSHSGSTGWTASACVDRMRAGGPDRGQSQVDMFSTPACPPSRLAAGLVTLGRDELGRET